MVKALHNVTQIWFTGVGGDDAGSARPALPSGVAATEDRTFGYTSWGALSSVTIPNTYTETYAFDSFSRVSSVTRWILGQTYSINKTYTTSYEYNLGGQLSKMIYPSGQQVSVNHDDKGRMQSLTNEPGDTSGYLTAMGYSIAGQVTDLTLGNGVVESYGYDANRLQLTSQAATKGATSLMNLTYNYQASAGQMGAGSTAGNAGQLMTISGTINSTAESAAYTYDLLGRLTTSNQTSNGSSAQRLFEYDRWGNRTAVYDGLPGGKTPPTQIQSVTFPTTFQQGGSAPTNRIASVTNSGSTLNYTYDAAGNVTNDGLHSYAFDAENRLVSIDAGATAQYKYDHQNRRVSRIVGSTWMHYVWEGSRVISEHDSATAYSSGYAANSARADNIYYGDRLIRSRQRSSGTAQWVTRYHVNDRLSERLTMDTSGNVVGRQAHLPFGEDFAESGTQDKRHFTSYERDGAAGLDYAVNRSYVPGVGRFNSADPYEESGSQFGPQSWNRYAYVENDPIHNVDPQGLSIAAPNPESPDPCRADSGGSSGNGCGGEGYCPPLPVVPEPGPRRTSCKMHVETRKGDRISQFTPESDQVFVGGNDTIGPATWGMSEARADGGTVPPHLIKNGYYYNTYIYASLSGGVDSSNWAAGQEAWVSIGGSYWNGADPSTIIEGGSSTRYHSPAEETPKPGNQRQFHNVLAWIDSPGWDPIVSQSRGLTPYNFTIRFVINSWVELKGKRVCSKTWTVTIKWTKGKNTEWSAH